MSDQTPALKAPHAPIDDSDYDSILAAVMETGRGRWFLREFAKRNRNTDTRAVLAAIGRLEMLLDARGTSGAAAPDFAFDAQAEPANDTAAQPFDARSLQATVRHMHEIADNLLECGAPSYLCNDLRARLQELEIIAGHTPPQAAAPVATERTITAPVADDPASAPVAAASVPDIAAENAAPSAIDAAPMVQPEMAAPAPVVEIEAAPVASAAPETTVAVVEILPPAPAEPRRDPFADIRALSHYEKIALFT